MQRLATGEFVVKVARDGITRQSIMRLGKGLADSVQPTPDNGRSRLLKTTFDMGHLSNNTVLVSNGSVRAYAKKGASAPFLPTGLAPRLILCNPPAPIKIWFDPHNTSLGGTFEFL